MMTNDIEVKKVIRELRGKSAALLVEATNDKVYVLKPVITESQRRMAINEWFMSNLLKTFAVTVPSIVAIRMRHDFRAMNRSALPLTSNALHFASELPANPNKRAIYDFLPRALHPSIHNRSDFVKTEILDLLVGKQDKRQAVFVRSTPTSPFTAYMIDHGNAFAGELWSVRREHNVRYWDHRIYRMRQAEQILNDLFTRLECASYADFEGCLEGIPSFWLSASYRFHFQRVLHHAWETRRHLEDTLSSVITY